MQLTWVFVDIRERNGLQSQCCEHDFEKKPWEAQVADVERPLLRWAREVAGYEQ